MPPPLTVPTPVVTPASATQGSTSPLSPGEMHGKIKIIPARPKSKTNIDIRF